MINVKLGINKVVATLSERVTLATPFYLLNLINTGDNTNKILLVSDSTPLNRVNTLTVELVSLLVNEDLSNGLVFLGPGTYKYQFYESETNDLIIGNNKLLEEGLLLYEIDIESKQYNTINIEKTYGS